MAIRLNYEDQAIRNNIRQAYYPPVVLKIYNIINECRLNSTELARALIIAY